MTTKCPVEEWEEICEIAATDEGADSELALKHILNLKNLQNFPNQRGKSGTKPLYVVADDDDIADINTTDNFFRPLPFNL